MTSAADDLTADVARAKRAARERALAARDALAPAERARLSTLVCARAAALPELRGARSILLFASFRSEVDTRPLLDALLARGSAVALPRVVGPRLLEARHVTDPDADLEPGAWGIPEPREGLPAVPPRRIDAVVVPGAAFSLAGARCGYGGGFYDAYLPRLAPGTPRIALAFEAQVVDELPCEPHDLRVDAIVTEARVISRSRPERSAGRGRAGSEQDAGHVGAQLARRRQQLGVLRRVPDGVGEPAHAEDRQSPSVERATNRRRAASVSSSPVSAVTTSRPTTFGVRKTSCDVAGRRCGR